MKRPIAVEQDKDAPEGRRDAKIRPGDAIRPVCMVDRIYRKVKQVQEFGFSEGPKLT